jgi:hypothetical protein
LKDTDPNDRSLSPQTWGQVQAQINSQLSSNLVSIPYWICV